MMKAYIATQRAVAARSVRSSSRVAPKNMKAPESGLTMENSAVKASRKVEKERSSSIGRAFYLGVGGLGRFQDGFHQRLRRVTGFVGRKAEAHDDQLTRLDDRDVLAVMAGHPKCIGWK